MKRSPTSIPFALGLIAGAAATAATLGAAYATGVMDVSRDASDLADRIRMFQRVDAARDHWPTMRAGAVYSGSPTDWAMETGAQDLVYASDPARPYAYRLVPAGSTVPDAGPTTPGATLDFSSNQRAIIRVTGPVGPARVWSFVNGRGFVVLSTIRSGHEMRQPLTRFENDWTAVSTQRNGGDLQDVEHASNLKLTPGRTYLFVPRPGVATVVRTSGPGSVAVGAGGAADLVIDGRRRSTFSYLGTTAVSGGPADARELIATEPRPAALTALLAEARSVR